MGLICYYSHVFGQKLKEAISIPEVNSFGQNNRDQKPIYVRNLNWRSSVACILTVCHELSRVQLSFAFLDVLRKYLFEPRYIMPLVDVNSESELKKFIDSERKAVVSFSSSNVPQCDHVYSVLKILSEDSAHSEIAFANVDAVAVSEISKQLKINSVPTVLFFLSGKEIHRVSGVDIPDITKAVMNLQSTPNASSNDLASRLHSLINMAPIMLFMKGSPEEPRCGFSRQIISILRSNNAKFETFDILQDEEVRQGLKSYSNWPTYPQLYVNGELVGGVDIVRELAESGELAQMLTVS